MKVKFTKKGVFTSLPVTSFGSNKSKIDQIMDLPDEEANMLMKKGWCVPVDDVAEIKSDDDDLDLLDVDEDEDEGED